MKGFNKFKQYQISCFADGTPVPDLMTEDEVIRFLRIPQISKSKDYSNVIDNLKRMRDLPRLKICNKLLYPKNAILAWVDNEITEIST